jgi:hypothetical protein
MKQEDLNSWEEFKDCLEEINEETQQLEANPNKTTVTEVLYRGQSNHKWDLSSTLQRRNRNMTLYEYLTILINIKSNVEQISGISWPTFSNINNYQLMSVYHFSIDLPEDTLGYMYFLRQHGFPSPLLDWTSCPSIASYFAFESIDSNVDRVAIYSFREKTGVGIDSKCTTEPIMDSLGPDVQKTSIRHSKQKAQYTICMKNPNNGKSLSNYIIANIEEDINRTGFSTSDNCTEDIPEAGNVVRKYTIPVTEKKKVLKDLESKGINRELLFPDNTQDDILIDLWNKYGL